MACISIRMENPSYRADPTRDHAAHNSSHMRSEGHESHLIGVGDKKVMREPNTPFPVTLSHTRRMRVTPFKDF